jgi:hypothetical protein
MSKQKAKPEGKSGGKPARKRPAGRPFTKGDPRIGPLMHKAALAAEEAGECQATAPAGSTTTGEVGPNSTGSSEGTLPANSGEPGGSSGAGVPTAVLGEASRMRHVWERPKWRDRLPWEKNLRAWLEKDPRGYQMQMMALERAEVQKAAAGSEGTAEADAGTVKCAELIEKLIVQLASSSPAPTPSG